jgi:hypothetical protein
VVFKGTIAAYHADAVIHRFKLLVKKDNVYKSFGGIRIAGALGILCAEGAVFVAYCLWRKFLTINPAHLLCKCAGLICSFFHQR